MHRFVLLKLALAAIAAAALCLVCAATFAQGGTAPSKEESAGQNQKISYGAESDFSSGNVWRGLVISDRAVASPSIWISTFGFTLTATTALALSDTTQGTRPRVTDLELEYEHEWKKFRFEPSLQTYWYRQPLSIEASSSMEAVLRVSYPVGPLRVFTSHSFDIWNYKGAYFGEAGIEYERRFSKKNEFSASVDTGWASPGFNNAYIGVKKSAFNLVDLECSFTRYLHTNFYLRPHIEFSSIVDRQLRAALPRSNLFTFGLAIGAEF